MLKKLLSLFLVLLISCGGGGGGGDGVTEPTSPTPVANFTGDPVSGVKPLTVNFVSTSTDATSYLWDFENDGSDDATGVSQSVQYNVVGIYSVRLTVTGPGGSDIMIRPDYITVLAQPPPVPVASFTATPVSGNAPLTVHFVSTSTNATSHNWDFDNDGSLDATGTSVSYTYNNPGTYSVSLTVSGAGGTDTTTETDFITVNAAPPTATFFGAPTSGTPELRVQFKNTSSNYTQSTWDFGDGTTSSEDSPIHTYTASGSYDVSLSVTGAGGSDTANESAYITLTDIATPAMILDSKYTDTSTGASVALDIKVMGVTGLAAAQAKLTYDASAVTIGDITAGDFLQGNTDPLFIVTKDESNGEVTIYTSSLSSDQPTSDGDGVIATVNFTINGSTNTNINFDSADTIMLDVDGADITINGLENGYLILE